MAEELCMVFWVHTAGQRTKEILSIDDNAGEKKNPF